MADGSQRRSGIALLGIAVVAGAIAGTVAVYVRGSADSNGGGCDGALATATRIAPLAVGEIAAFNAADTAERYGELSFLASDGSPMTLADLAGRAVLLNLWATWCVPCRAEMPALARLQTEVEGDDFTVVTVNVDVRNEERARAFLNEIGATNLDFYFDPSLGVFNSFKRRGHAFGLPTTVLVDAEGCGIGTVEGPAEWDSDRAKKLILAAIGRD